MLLKTVNERIVYLAFFLLTVPQGETITDQENFTFTEEFHPVNEDRIVDFEYYNFGFRSIVSY